MSAYEHTTKQTEKNQIQVVCVSVAVAFIPTAKGLACWVRGEQWMLLTCGSSLTN